MKKKLSDFLNGKPLWIWWIAYLLITAGLFGLFNLIIYLFGINPVVGVFVLIATGILWGYIAFSINKSKRKGAQEGPEGKSTE